MKESFTTHKGLATGQHGLELYERMDGGMSETSVAGSGALREDQPARRHLDALVADAKVPGVQYCVVDAEGVVFEYAGGWADIATAQPMDRTTTLMAYSMSKTITAAAVLRLAAQGRLGLDDPVSRYVDGLPYQSPITIRQVLAHTGGLPAPIPLRWVHPVTEHGGFDAKAALTARLKRHGTLRWEPGRKYAYSNLGYWLLGPLIERAGGQSFEAYVTDHVLRPLGASPAEMSFAIPDPTHHATGYLEKYSFLNLAKRLVVDGQLIGHYRGRWLEIRPHYVDGPAFGGLVGTARGFGKFLQDQLRTHSVLFDDDTRNGFYDPQHTRDGKQVPMTPGWHVSDGDMGRHFYKEGGGGGFHAMMRLYRGRGIGTVVLTNATAFDVRGLLDRLDGRFLERQGARAGGRP